MATKQPGIWGIDLGQCALKAVRMENIDGKVTATAFDYIEHPKILSQPDADPDELTRQALEQFLSRNELRGDHVAISVPGQSGLTRFVKLPPVEEKKIDDIVRFEAKQQIPFPLEEVIWDYQKISAGTVSGDFAMETEIGLFAIKKDMVYRAIQQFQEVNIELHCIQMAPLALCNFVAYEFLKSDSAEGASDAEGEAGEPRPEEGVVSEKLLNKGRAPKTEKQTEAPSVPEGHCVVALDIGADNSNLVITDASKIIWQRAIPLGGSHFTRALTKELKLTFAKAEHVKRNAIKSPDLKKILTALRPVLNDFVNEVQRSLTFFTNTHRDAKVAYMVGLGNAFRLPGLQKFLQEKLGIEVRKLQTLHRVEGEEVTKAPQFTENVMSFAVAYGLALQGLKLSKIKTNLLPQEIHRERFIREKKPWVAATAAVILFGVFIQLFGLGVLYNKWLGEKVKTVPSAQGPLGEISGNKQAYDEVKNKTANRKEIIKQLAVGGPERFNWDWIIRYINDCLPRPDGKKLSHLTAYNVEAYDKYWVNNKNAQKAYYEWMLTQLNPNPDVDKQDKEEDIKEEIRIAEFYKQHLVEVNVEGVDFIYTDDLSIFFDKISKDNLIKDYIDAEDLKRIENQKEQLPKKGWLVAIRGFTYHKDKAQFVYDTYVENLRRPLAKGVEDIKLDGPLHEWVTGKKKVDPNAKQSESTSSEDQSPTATSPESEPSASTPPIAPGGEEDPTAPKTPDKRIGYVVLYKYKTIENPSPGILNLAQSSPLRELTTKLVDAAGANPGGSGPGMPAGEGMPGGGGGPGVPGGEGGNAAAPPDPRSTWANIGTIAMQALGLPSASTGPGGPGGAPGPGGANEGLNPGGPGGPGGPGTGQGPAQPTAPLDKIPRAPRTEFVIVFVWQEPVVGFAEGADGENAEVSGGVPGAFQ
ncbi:MAG: type IV pilus assembly protein PilM [Gemmataceae bacterium]